MPSGAPSSCARRMFLPERGRLLAACGAAAAVACVIVGRLVNRRIRRNVVFNHIATHRSIRNFSSAPVPPALTDKILRTAMRSSNNGNMQTGSVIITRDRAALEKLAVIHDNSKIATCAQLVTFVCDWSLMKRWCELSGASPGYDNFNAFLTGALDAMVYAQSVALCAEAAGLGICFLGSTIWETDRLNTFFELPVGTHVVTSIMMGWPTEDPALRARLEAAGHIHHERYQPMSDKQVVQHYASRETEGWNRYIKLYGPAWKTKLEAHKLQNLAQVYTCLKYSAQDFRLWSRRLLSTIQKQGFSMNGDAGSDKSPCPACNKWSHCLDPSRLVLRVAVLNCPGCNHYTPLFIKLIGEAAKRDGVECSFVEFIPADGQLPDLDKTGKPDGVDVYIISGSRDAAYENDPWIKNMLEWVKKARAKRVRVLAVCFGHQCIAHALGGRVALSTECSELQPGGFEIGKMSFVPNQTALDWYAQALGCPLLEPDGIVMNYVHQDSIVPSSLPALEAAAGLVGIGGTPICPCQGLIDTRYGEILTFQGHPEFTSSEVLDCLEVLTKKGRLPARYPPGRSDADVQKEAANNVTEAQRTWLGSVCFRHLAGPNHPLGLSMLQVCK